MNSNHSQLNQDIQCLKFYNYKKNGFFIEIGASDGITLSNTYLLEKEYNWKGICVEPIPSDYEKLKINRPNSICIQEALYNLSDEKIEFIICEDIKDPISHLYSGIEKNLNVHKNKVLTNAVKINVNTISLLDLLDKYQAPKLIDYLSLDTEGSEFEILKAFDFTKYKFGLIDVEHNYFEPQRTLIRQLLISNGYIYLKENNWDDTYIHSEHINNNFCDLFIDDKIVNIKGDNFKDRFTDIMSDPNNLVIKRVINAGNIIDDCVVMHNGILIKRDSYYEDFSKILELNKGCHEPAEERMFDLILKYIPDNGTMIELGSYWSFYSIWFNKFIKNSKNFCIEPNPQNLEIGKVNAKLNNADIDFTKGFIGKNNIKVSEFILEKNIDYIDILHSDIQGFELEMLEDITNLLTTNKIGYLFISTHSNKLHYDCINFLEKHNYKIIASADFDNETFCYDGIIVSCQSNNPLEKISLGNRKKTILNNVKYF